MIALGEQDDMIPDRIGNFDLYVNLTEPCVIIEEEEEEEEEEK